MTQELVARSYQIAPLSLSWLRRKLRGLGDDEAARRRDASPDTGRLADRDAELEDLTVDPGRTSSELALFSC